MAIKSKIKEYPRVKYRSIGFRDLASVQDEGVDLFMANYVLDRVDDLPACFKAMRGCLSERGRIMASTFFVKGPSEIGPESRRYNQEDFISELEKNGFLIETITGDDLCGSFLANVCGIRPHDLIVIAKPIDNSEE